MLKKRLGCPYCGDVKDEVWVWQSFFGRSHKKCRCDINPEKYPVDVKGERFFLTDRVILQPNKALTEALGRIAL